MPMYFKVGGVSIVLGYESRDQSHVFPAIFPFRLIIWYLIREDERWEFGGNVCTKELNQPAYEHSIDQIHLEYLDMWMYFT